MLDVSPGKCIVEKGERQGDALTLWSNSLLKGAVGAYRFDGYGTPGRRVCLLQKNKVESLLADKRYADYLKVPATGDLGNFEVAPAQRPFQDLLDPKNWGADRLYQLQAFSAFEPNSITG